MLNSSRRIGGEDTHGNAWPVVVSDWFGRHRYIRRALPIWLGELSDKVEPSRPNLEEPGVGYEHGCADVSHLDLYTPPPSSLTIKDERMRAGRW